MDCKCFTRPLIGPDISKQYGGKLSPPEVRGGSARTWPSSFVQKCTLDFQIQWIFKCLLHLKPWPLLSECYFPFFLPADLYTSPPCWFPSQSVSCDIGGHPLQFLSRKKGKGQAGLNAVNISNVSLYQHTQVIWSHPYSQKEIEKKKGINLLYLLVKHDVK